LAIKKSISGMRGTIGGQIGDNLTPVDIVEMTAAYGKWLIEAGQPKKVVVGRDGRISGPIVSQLAIQTLLSMGISVVDLGLSTTPTVEIAVPEEQAGGGIIFTASHNPREWNALKLLNHKGEFISAEDGAFILKAANERDIEFCPIDDLGSYSVSNSYIDIHVDKILDLNVFDIDTIGQRKFRVVVDCINSSGALALPPLFERIGVDYELINQDVTGEFAHNPEPVPANLADLAARVVSTKADMGIAVDPDVDRLVFVCEDGSMFSEEYTIVAAADFILKQNPGNTVSNLSSSRALADITKKYGGTYHYAAVGEVNVVNKMKEVNAVIGGEGNGGVIYPKLHYGRDALVGIVMVLNHLADLGVSLSELKKSYPSYQIVKDKIVLENDADVTAILDKIKNVYLGEEINEEDGLKIDFADGWVHIRASNTEPVLRVIAESGSAKEAEVIVAKILKLINDGHA